MALALPPRAVRSVRAAGSHGTVLLAVLPVALLALPVTTRVTPADAASLALVVACAVALVRRRPAAPRLGAGAAAVLGVPAVAFAVVTVAAPDPAAALPGFLRYLQVFVLVPLALVLLLRSRRDVRLVAVAVVGLALVQGAVGVVQYATGTGASYMGENVRAVGTFGPLNVMGMATVVSYGIIAALCLGLVPPPGAPRWWRPVALGCAGALCVPLAVSFSRGAWLATGAAVGAVLLIAGWRRARRTLALLLCGGVLLVGGAALVSDAVADRLTSIGQVTGTPDQSVIDRYAMWDAALGMWRQEPWTGVGPRGFAEYRDTHASLALSAGSDTAGAGAEFQVQELLSPHNMYLLLLSEQGLLGAAAVVGGWAALLLGAVLRLRRCGPVDGGLLATGLMVWLTVNFVYADIGGPTTVLTAVAFGLVAWWALAPAALRPEPAARPDTAALRPEPAARPDAAVPPGGTARPERQPDPVGRPS
ncbi:O-antigen ligase family protein [Streptomyces sp. XM4011]|uniref:O-antigen ligase family protein n=1 Tax=Streptomyces sp. XM4011 TaxID=2929780 RepID=UPI001FF897D3|nr:O-antigen ligase family protein [Streptomyces sp. XM4011]MCK1817042.1 O-antigen ligase family protein [Streptomyces sp. XM4011]